MDCAEFKRGKRMSKKHSNLIGRNCNSYERKVVIKLIKKIIAENRKLLIPKSSF